MSAGWIEGRDFEVKYWGNAAQADNFSPSKKFRQDIFECSQKTNSSWNEKWSYEGLSTVKSSHWQTGRIRQNPCKKESFSWEKRFVVSDKIYSSNNLFFSVTLFELHKVLIS